MEIDRPDTNAELYEALTQNQHELTSVMAMRALLDKEWQELQDERMGIIRQLRERDQL